MARALRVVAAATLLLVPLAACSLIVDTSGLSDPADGRGDAATIGADATADTSNGTDGAGAADGAAGQDGDAGVDAGDSSTEACTPSATRICDRFDDSTPGATWTSRDMNNRGTITFDAVGLSLPHAFEGKVGAGSGDGNANLIESYPSTRSNIRCDLDLKVLDAPTAGEIDVIDLITNLPGGQSYHVYFALFDNTWAVAEFQGAGDGGSLDRHTDLAAVLPKNTWFHVAFAQAGATATLTANGTVATLGSLTMPTGKSTSVTIGITYASSIVQSADLLVDNVDCTVLP